MYNFIYIQILYMYTAFQKCTRKSKQQNTSSAQSSVHKQLLLIHQRIIFFIACGAGFRLRVKRSFRKRLIGIIYTLRREDQKCTFVFGLVQIYINIHILCMA